MNHVGAPISDVRAARYAAVSARAQAQGHTARMWREGLGTAARREDEREANLAHLDAKVAVATVARLRAEHHAANIRARAPVALPQVARRTPDAADRFFTGVDIGRISISAAGAYGGLTRVQAPGMHTDWQSGRAWYVADDGRALGNRFQRERDEAYAHGDTSTARAAALARTIQLFGPPAEMRGTQPPSWTYETPAGPVGPHGESPDLYVTDTRTGRRWGPFHGQKAYALRLRLLAEAQDGDRGWTARLFGTSRPADQTGLLFGDESPYIEVTKAALAHSLAGHAPLVSIATSRAGAHLDGPFIVIVYTTDPRATQALIDRTSLPRSGPEVVVRASGRPVIQTGLLPSPSAARNLVPEGYNTSDWGTAAWLENPHAARAQAQFWIDRVADARAWPAAWRALAVNLADRAFIETQRDVVPSMLPITFGSDDAAESARRHTEAFYGQLSKSWHATSGVNTTLPAGWDKLGNAWRSGVEAARTVGKSRHLGDVGMIIYQTVYETQKTVETTGFPIFVIVAAVVGAVVITRKL